jgi:hypothetical protein
MVENLLVEDIPRQYDGCYILFNLLLLLLLLLRSSFALLIGQEFFLLHIGNVCVTFRGIVCGFLYPAPSVSLTNLMLLFLGTGGVSSSIMIVSRGGLELEPEDTMGLFSGSCRRQFPSASS